MLYYRMFVVDEAGSGHDFRRPSNLPFPSPIGSHLFVLALCTEEQDQGAHRYVVSYKHQTGDDGELLEFYMNLGSEEEVGKNPGGPKPPHYSNYEEVVGDLLKQGWEICDD